MPNRQAAQKTIEAMRTVGCRIGLWFILLLALYLRTAGLFRGLAGGIVFHPDSPKQVYALQKYLDGDRLWYYDSIYYDGYPYGLNRLDEVLIRAAYAGLRPLASHLVPPAGFLPFPDRHALHYWALVLRVLYGMAAILLTVSVARHLGLSPPAALAAGLLLALSPLATVVAHSATGDVGVDLFALAAVWALCRYRARGRAAWLAAAGLGCGLAFAAKYQGLFVGFVVGVFLLLDGKVSRGGVVSLARQTMLVAAGAAAGVAFGLPGFLVDAHAAWQNVRGNVDFVRNYNAGQDLLREPLRVQAAYGVAHNVPSVLEAMGWTLCLLAAMGLVLAAAGLCRRRDASAPPPDRPEDVRTARLRFSAFLFIPAALLASTALKPTLQTFHFSYLAPFAALAAAFAAQTLWRRHGLARALAAVLLTAAAAELGARARHEDFFWRREELRCVSDPYFETVFRGLKARGLRAPWPLQLKEFEIENDALPVFRNRAPLTFYADAPSWRALHIAPVPTIPYPAPLSWVLMNGPVLPRNDRLFALPAGETVRKDFVFYGDVPEVALGLRSGTRPCEVRVEFGGEERLVRLPPNAQVVETLRPRPCRRLKPRAPDQKTILIVPGSFSSVPGTAWVAAMTDPREVRNFRAFGGDAGAAASDGVLSPKEIDLLKDLLTDTQFLECPQADLSVSADGVRLEGRDVPLPAGRYVLDCTVDAGGEGAELVLELADTAKLAARLDTRRTFALAPGGQTVRWEFAKPFAPLEVNVRATCPRGECRILSWRLDPDAPAILSDLAALWAGGAQPAWLAPGPPLPAAPREEPVGNVVWGKRMRLDAVSFPDRLTPGQPFEYGFRFAVLDYGRLRRFDALACVVHLTRPDGTPVVVLDYAMLGACFGDAPLAPQEGRIPEGVQAGEYELRVGLYDSGPRVRDKVRVSREARYPADHGLATVKKVTVLPPAP